MKRLLRLCVFFLLIVGFLVTGQVVQSQIGQEIVTPLLSHYWETDEPVQGMEVPHLEALPDFPGGMEWVNDRSTSRSQLEDNPVLVVFWSPSCIPCSRLMPHIREWSELYASFGLKVVGVYSPSFPSENSMGFIQQVVIDQGIDFPVLYDPDFVVWDLYRNEFWPSMYLFDQEGDLVFSSPGMIDQDFVEQKVLSLLEIEKEVAEQRRAQPYVVDWRRTGVGYYRQFRLASPEKIQNDKEVTYSLPDAILPRYFAFGGTWVVQRDEAYSTSPGAILRTQENGPLTWISMDTIDQRQTKVEVTLDGKFVPLANRGEDLRLDESTGTSFLYIRNRKHYKILENMTGEHTLELRFPKAGAIVNTITHEYIAPFGEQ